jgi:hypothetical protein
MGLFQQSAAEAPAKPAPAGSAADFSGKPPRPTDGPPKTQYFGAGNPARRQTMEQMFGPR